MDVGLEFAHYRVIEHIGRGGMADVWSARDQSLNRTVAIKTVARDLSHDVNPLKLFEREAQTIANLEHPHILPIYEFGEYDGQLYIVMRYVSGGSLEDMLEDGPLPLSEVMRLGRAVAQSAGLCPREQGRSPRPQAVQHPAGQLPTAVSGGLRAGGGRLGPKGARRTPVRGRCCTWLPNS